VLTGDFTGDGRPDLAFANSAGGTVSVLAGNGDGTFRPAVTSNAGGGPVSLAAGDFNADGKLDLATANYTSVTLLLGNGDGTFRAPAFVDTGTGFDLISVAAGDFNADGKLDLGVASTAAFPGGPEGGTYYLGEATVLLGTGTGSFASAGTVGSTGFEENKVTSAVADVNNDGHLDLVLGGGVGFVGVVTVLLGTGTGTLANQVSSINYAFYRSWPSSMALGDVNGDGKLDLVTSNVFQPGVPVQLGNGLGSFGDAHVFATGSYPLAVALADFDGNGALDVVAVVSGGGVNVLQGTGSGDFGPPQITPTIAGTLVAGDFNGDGRPDVATSGATVLLNDGVWPPPPPPAPPSITIGDVTVTEGHAGTRTATFTVTLSESSGQPVSVAYSTGSGTATPGSDYQSASGTLMIPAGQTTGTITVLVNGDRLAEPNETFFVNLSSPTNATIADGQGAGTILDDEPRISISDVSNKEGKKTQTTLFTFTVTLSAAYDQPVTMSYRTVDGTAKTSDGDYVAKTGTLIFAPGETTKTITIEVKGDSKKEANETFYLDLFGLSSNALFTKNRGIGTILNDD
jgi:hypothetical protein